MKIIPHIKYIYTILKHKFLVLFYGLQTGAPIWKLITHDFSKFSSFEYKYYLDKFYGENKDPMGFLSAWEHHKSHNSHHWEYWRSKTDEEYMEHGEYKPMPEWAVREMVADWIAATIVYSDKKFDINNWDWYQENKYKMRLHPMTRTRVCNVLAEIGMTAKNI